MKNLKAIVILSLLQNPRKDGRGGTRPSRNPPRSPVFATGGPVSTPAAEVLLTLIAVIALFAGCRDKIASHPPYRDEVDPPPGYSRDGMVWLQIPTNTADTIRSALQAKGYNLQEYWDPEITQEGSDQWNLFFQGTMIDPGNCFFVIVDKKTGKIEILPGA